MATANKHITPALNNGRSWQEGRRLGTFHMGGQAAEDYEVARSNFFTLVVEGLEPLMHPSKSLDLSTYKDPNLYISKADSPSGSDSQANIYKNAPYTAQDVLQLSINKAFVPHFDLGTVEVKRGNSIVKYADTPTWQSGTLEFQDFVGLNVKEILQAWQDLAYDPISDTQGRAANWYDGTTNELIRQGYKKDCTLIEYTPDFEEIRSWTLVGCWVKSLQESPFDVTNSNGGRQITVQFEYDRAYLNSPDKLKGDNN